ncbi:hypothetical protein [Kitasatospora sp. NPDC057198]|uniref:hypothetical protein n=1 Tax=Kitasatospora sp. NPDC057198 TaxID=3346046 RepID=UPI00363E8673
MVLSETAPAAVLAPVAAAVAVPEAAAATGPSRGEPSAGLRDESNAAVRRPDRLAETGPAALAVLAALIDRLDAADPLPGPADAPGTVWLPDTNGRLDGAMMLRGSFPDADLTVIASQYGEDAHRRGRLVPDRVLAPDEHARLVDRAVDWADQDHELPEVLAEFGTPSVVYGDPAPERPKTLAYLGADRTAPVVTFHLDTGGVLLAARATDEFPAGWAVTPAGLDQYH